MSSVLRVTGSPIDAGTPAEPTVRSPMHRVRQPRAVAVANERDANATVVDIATADDEDLVELELGTGAVIVTGVDRMREFVAQGARVRGDDQDIITASLPFVAADRGVGAIALRIVRVFRADPVNDVLARLATREAIARIESQLAKAPGLYRLDDRGGLDTLVTSPVGGDRRPVLVFLHGTASSTSGSFSRLFAGTPEWRELRKHYGTDVYALEHRTMSESPAQNALMAAKLLAPGATVHLVSHSRGGLVGELLCRGGFDAAALQAFERRPGRPAGERELLLELGAELGARTLRIERFVRVACPAAGTLLASNRLDLYLSLLFNALKLAAPDGVDVALDRVSALLLEIARRRAHPSELPGLEAQRPESPFVHFLNRADQAPVDQDLTVIAGDLRSGNLRQTLQTIAAYTYFLQKNDLVVDTRAMYGGLPRKMESGGWVSFHEGPTVSHFTYFSEDASRRALAAALLRDDKTQMPPGGGFVSLRDDLSARSFAFYRDAADADERIGAEGGGRVFVVPDIFGTELYAGDKRLWPDAGAIAGGAIYDLAPEKSPPEARGLVASARRLDALARLMANTCAIVPVGYDWRLGIGAGADALKAVLDDQLDATGPVGIVAHGLGALAVLDLARRDVPQWREFRKMGGRAVLLAPPLDGAAFALRLTTGTSPLFRTLETLDGVGAASDLVKLLVALPGLVDLLPGEALQTAWWQRYGGDAPADAALADARKRRSELVLALEDEALWFVFGATDATVVPALDTEDNLATSVVRDGDGWMVNPRGATNAARTWYVPAGHEVLPSDAGVARVVTDLVLRGNTAAGDRHPPDAPATRTEVEPLRFPTQDDLEAALLFGTEPPQPVKRVLRVRAAHGSLDRRRIPVMVGHYNGDTIAGAETFLDRCLGGALSNRLGLGPGRYPGPVGSARYESTPDSIPPGAIVIGLGDVGDLTANNLTRGATAGVLEYVLHEVNRQPGLLAGNDPRQRLSLSIASLLIGTRGGRSLSVRRSISAIVNGVLQANRQLDEQFGGKVLVDTLWFIELWADVATQAGQAIEALDDDITLDLRPDEAIEPRGQLIPLEGARGNSRETTDWAWWRRIIISGEEQENGPAALRFTSLTERARAEDRMVLTGGLSLEDLLNQATRPAGAVGEYTIPNALYSMLLPPAVRETLYDSAELVLVVDRASGQYPWELLARMRDGALEPLIARISIIRQFRSVDFRESLIPARTMNALVIGNPAGVTPPLAGAERETQELTPVLEQRGYRVTLSVNEDAATILQKFFLGDYRIMHIAAHGEYRANDAARTGVVIGPSADGHPRVLTAETFAKLPTVPDLVFLNCCHLGRLDPQAGRLAASVAETLIKLGVRCVVVAGWAVNDAAARLFSNTFYSRFLDGVCFGDAVQAARQAVWREHRESTTWGAYQCYGDPMFAIAERRTEDAVSGARPFISVSEAREELEDIAAAAATSGTDSSYLVPRLQAIESRLEREWQFDASLLYARARAHAALRDNAEAIRLYHDALYANDATAPIKSAEQFGNLLARLADEVAAEALKGESSARTAVAEALLARLAETAGTDDDAEVPVAERCRTLARVWLSRVSGLGATPERYGLDGSRLRRAALAQPPGRVRQRLLRESAAAYARGTEVVRARTGRAPIYPTIPAVAGAWAAGRLGPDEKTKLLTWLTDCRASVQHEEQDRGRTAWTAVTPIDADLLEALLARPLTADGARQLAGRYRDCMARYGTATERASMRDQVEFLARIARERRKGGGTPRRRTNPDALDAAAFLEMVRTAIA